MSISEMIQHFVNNLEVLACAKFRGPALGPILVFRGSTRLPKPQKYVKQWP